MINALPTTLRPFIENAESVAGKWPVKVSMEHVAKWMLQFDPDDYAIAGRLIERLDVLGAHDARAALEVAHTKLLREMARKGTPLKGNNTLFTAAGDTAKSGGLISYHYRIAAEIPEDNFFSADEEPLLDFEKIENVVLVDDVVGTGATLAKEVERLAEGIYPLSKTRNIFVLTVAGYKEGMQTIVEKTGATVISALEYSSLDTVSNLDAPFYGSSTMTHRTEILERIKRYCRSISKSDLGYGGIGGLLVFDHNTPNTTLPIIWHNGLGWTPLFPRATRIPGSSKILKSAALERENIDKNNNVELTKAEITLFVEGKFDELFVECLKQRHGLAGRLQVNDISTIALGGLSRSQRMLDILKTTRKHAIIILDDDEGARRVSSNMAGLTDVAVIHLKPSFVGLLDLKKIYENSDRFPGLPDQQNSPTESGWLHWLHMIERATLKRIPVSASPDRIVQLVDEFLDLAKYEEFVAGLKIKVDEVLGRQLR